MLQIHIGSTDRRLKHGHNCVFQQNNDLKHVLKPKQAGFRDDLPKAPTSTQSKYCGICLNTTSVPGNQLI